MPVLTPTRATLSNSPAAARVDSIRILADDLTGACDSAVAFLPAGHTVRVWLGAAATAAATETVQAFNTASRDLAPDHAFHAVTRAAAALDRNEQTLLFKKVDSAGRGHLAEEVIAAHQALGTSAVLFAPSFPSAGRTVRDGILLIEDATGARSSLPLIPLFQDAAPTAGISRPDQIPRVLAAGATVLVCDASTQSDLDVLAAIDHPKLLYAGSAGLARAIATRFAGSARRPEPLPPISKPLTICGTPHPLTQLQMKHLADAHPHHPRLEIHSEAAAILACFETHRPDALLLTGGDTALLVLTTLGANSILLRGELAPGIPWGLIQGGAAHGRVVVTKSGGFGAVDVLSNIVRGFS